MLAVLVGLGLGTTMSALRPEPFGVVLADGRPERLMDFASIRGLTCAAWSGDLLRDNNTSIYTPDAQLKATERWTGLPARIAFPFAYSPTMLLVLEPLCRMPARWAYVTWSLASILGAGWMILRARAHWLVTLNLVTLLTVHIIALGQSALLTTTGLFFMMFQDTKGPPGRSNFWSSSVVLWLLSAKPPLAITAGVALLASRRWKTIVCAAGFTLAATLAVTPWLGAGWMRDYVALLGSYERVGLPAALAWSIVPQQMSNLRAALSLDFGLGDNLAARWSMMLWSGTLIAVVVAAWLRPFPPGSIWGLCIMLYLLLCPHVSATEDVAFFCVLAGAHDERVPQAVRIGAAALALVGLLLTPDIGPAAGYRPPVLFFAKIALLLYVVATGVFLGARDGKVAP